MVQMKDSRFWRRKALASLYIPHGSDERIKMKTKKEEKKYFISHMVQMKVFKLLLYLPSRYTLYPTWFR